jgi:hypothetical protein
MQRPLVCLVAFCLLSPLVSYAQDSTETLSPDPSAVAGTKIAPAFLEGRKTFPITNYSLLLNRDATTADVSTEPDPSPDPQGNGNGNPSALPATGYVFPSRSELNRHWLRNTIGLRALAGATLRATWTTWVNETPEEWGEGASGWFRRFGVGLLDNGINQSALTLISRATHQDPIYYSRSGSPFLTRVKHAIQMSYESRNHQGDAVFSPAKIISPFVGPMVTRNTIYPDRFNAGDAAVSGATYLAGSVGWNLVREFFFKSPHW